MLTRTPRSFLTVLGLLLIAAILVLAVPGSWLGWLLALVVLLLPFAVANRLHLSRVEMQVLLFIAFLHVFVAIFLVLVGQGFLSGFSPDAYGFGRYIQLVKIRDIDFRHDAAFYLYGLKEIYNISPSLLSLYMTSVFGFSLFCLVLRRVMQILELKNFYVLVLLVSALIPTDIILTSVTLREVWQMLLVALAMLFSLSIFAMKKSKLRYWVGLLLVLACLAVLHRGLIYISVLWIFVFWASLKILILFDRVDWLLRFVLVCLFLFFLVAVLGMFASHFEKKLEFILGYSARVGDAGSAYPVFFEPGHGLIRNLLFLPLSLFYYWFYPFPWDIHRAKDIYGCLLGLIRFFFIAYSVYFVFRTDDYRQRYLGGAVFILLVFISMVFAIGTSNYGTSMRHNILTFWGFVVLGLPGYYLHRLRKPRRFTQ